MKPLATELQLPTAHSDWVRLRTLTLLRWAAVAGQLAAITVAYLYFQVELDLLLCGLVVGASILVNIIAQVSYAQTRLLSDAQAMAMLLFDVTQLALLLLLTGGLMNPFAVLILAPATIAATALGGRSAFLVGLVTVALVSLIGLVNVPLKMQGGGTLAVPPIFGFGFWLAIVIAVVFQGLYARRIATEARAMGTALFATQLALAREQKLSDLGGVVAAAAHELGTPLATIKLASAELLDELADRPELYDDAQLIHAQAARCHEILQSMGRAGKDDSLMHSVPLSTLVREAAEPHLGRGKAIHFDLGDTAGGQMPVMVRRAPEILHGLRNLIQNAVDFAQSQVWIEARCKEERIFIRISDDGAGIPPQLLGRIGDPFLRGKAVERDTDARPGYQGMGLGLFIAKTLLERTGAVLTFANSESPRRSGATVSLNWPRTLIAAQSTQPLGENAKIIR